MRHADRRRQRVSRRDARPRRAPSPHRPCRGPQWQGQAARPAFLPSGRLSGRVLVEIDENIVALQHHLIGAQRERARRRLHRAGLHVEGAGMQAALDDAVFEEAVGEARRGVGAFVVGDVELALEVVDGEPLSPTSYAFTVSGAISDCAQTRTTLSAMDIPSFRRAAAALLALRHKTARRLRSSPPVIATGGNSLQFLQLARRVVIGPIARHNAARIMSASATNLRAVGEPPRSASSASRRGRPSGSATCKSRSARSSPSTTSRSTSSRASSSSSSVRRAAARRRCCAFSPAWKRRPPAPSRSTRRRAPTGRKIPWCSRASRSFPG